MLKIKHITASQWMDHADAWNSLWAASSTSEPTVRAEVIKLWCESFAAGRDWFAIAVEHEGRLIAGLPLVCNSTAGVTTYQLPSDCTVTAGDLLLDATSSLEQETLQLLASELKRLPGKLGHFESIQITTPRWTAFFEALRRCGCQIHISEGKQVGVVDILHDWDAYVASWSRNHRSALKRSDKKLRAKGNVEVERIRSASDDELFQAMETCFAIEDRTWKGENNTSILKSLGLRDYYHAESRLMRDNGLLDLWLLKVGGQVIAFEYCSYAKGTCFSNKISFDPDWQNYSAGRLLRRYQLEAYHQDGSARLLDTLGDLCDAKAKWVTSTYTTGRCFVALGGLSSQLAMRGFKATRNLVKQMRNRPEASNHAPDLGAKRYLSTATPGKDLAVTVTPAIAPSVGVQVDSPIASN